MSNENNCLTQEELSRFWRTPESMGSVMSCRGTSNLQSASITNENDLFQQSFSTLPTNETTINVYTTNVTISELSENDVTDVDIITKTLELSCSSSYRDKAVLKYSKGCIQTNVCECGVDIKHKMNIIKNKDKLTKLIKDIEKKKENSGSTSKMQHNRYKFKCDNVELEIYFKYSDETNLKAKDSQGRSSYIILSNDSLYRLKTFLEKIIKLGGIKMSSILKINCVEEEKDNMEVLDCNDGKNVAIKTDNDGEIGVVFMSPEDAVRMAEEILEKYGKVGK